MLKETKFPAQNVMWNKLKLSIIFNKYVHINENDLRKASLPRYYCSWRNLNTCISIMKSTNKNVIINLVKFGYSTMQLRIEST
jgi:hypothetical protein